MKKIVCIILGFLFVGCVHENDYYIQCGGEIIITSRQPEEKDINFLNENGSYFAQNLFYFDDKSVSKRINEEIYFSESILLNNDNKISRTLMVEKYNAEKNNWSEIPGRSCYTESELINGEGINYKLRKDKCYYSDITYRISDFKKGYVGLKKVSIKRHFSHIMFDTIGQFRVKWILTSSNAKNKIIKYKEIEITN